MERIHCLGKDAMSTVNSVKSLSGSYLCEFPMGSIDLMQDKATFTSLA